jgi:nicotinamidase-related amidase
MVFRLLLLVIVLASTSSLVFAASPVGSALELHTRSRDATARADEAPNVARETVTWDSTKTAMIIVDMWDDHWCKGAAKRVAELAGPMNKLVGEARKRGVFIVHCPSTCVDFYKDSAARRRAIDAPYAKPPIELATAQRWGTAWNWPDESREPALPIDDSDMGCDCPVRCEIAAPWTRQVAAIQIDDSRDAITDSGQELHNLFAERGIENVIICGVHLNMCVLGRPFGIRQLVKLGSNVVLVRDMTDTMYSRRMRPFVDHFAGTDLVVEHVEKYWCPTIESTDLVGGEPFRFAEAPQGAPRASN